MKTMTRLLIFCFLALGSTVWAIPNSITYQGTLKEKGFLAQGPKTITFQLTDQSGNTPYSNVISTQVNVVNGSFSTQLSFQLVQSYTWESITPYIKATVEGQALRPTEPVTATVYAMVSQSVVDGAVTRAKVDTVSFDAPGPGLVPPGAIMMFKTSCPSGWSVFTELQGRFPAGADPNNLSQFAIGESSGAISHSHTVNAHTHVVPDHAHSIDNSSLQVAIGIRNINFDNNLVMQVGGAVGAFSVLNANQWFGNGAGMSHPASVGSNPGNVGINGPAINGGTNSSGHTVTTTSSPGTDSQNNLPPYKALLFCQKQ